MVFLSLPICVWVTGAIALIVAISFINFEKVFSKGEKTLGSKDPPETRLQAWINAINERKKILRILKEENPKQFKEITSDGVYPFIGARKLR